MISSNFYFHKYMNAQYYSYIQCKPNGSPFYVGKGKGRRGYDFRKRSHHYKNIITKYGAKNILVGKIDCSSEEIAFELEKGLIKCLRRSAAKLCNKTDGGDGTHGWVASAEIRAKMASAQTGKRYSTESRAKMSASAKVRVRPPMSIETREKISTANKGLVRGLEARAKISAAKTGKKRSAEFREKMAASRRGKTHSEATRVKMSASRKKWHEANRTKVNYEIIKRPEN